MAFTIVSIVIGAGLAVWAREDARAAQRHAAAMARALKPFADLVEDAALDDAHVPAHGLVHCTIYGGDELGDLDINHFHQAAAAYAVHAP